MGVKEQISSSRLFRFPFPLFPFQGPALTVSFDEWLRYVKRGDYREALASFESLACEEEHQAGAAAGEEVPLANQLSLVVAIEQFCVFAKGQWRLPTDDPETSWKLLADVASAHQDDDKIDAIRKTDQRVDAAHDGIRSNHERPDVKLADPAQQAVWGLCKLGYTTDEIAVVLRRPASEVAAIIHSITLSAETGS